MFANIYAIIVISLAAVTLSADHAVTFTNNYGLGVRPIIKNTADGVTYTRPWLGGGQSWFSSIAENVGRLASWLGKRMKNKVPTASVALDLSATSPPPIFATFEIANSKTGSNSPSCPPSDAWNPNSDDASSLRFFNTPRVDITVVFCP
ncbi:hypothetical protein RHS04_05749 [Rhizoctonia solani]|uniref:Uncharacterized protein n=1 Tax=Rhizoctonia solani TaxID=456999 RepID=A0A8H7H6Q8_9AGAM|nr:hypothetical protein RHS04_05749 [Rhizoctonia solani]